MTSRATRAAVTTAMVKVTGTIAQLVAKREELAQTVSDLRYRLRSQMHNSVEDRQKWKQQRIDSYTTTIKNLEQSIPEGEARVAAYDKLVPMVKADQAYEAIVYAVETARDRAKQNVESLKQNLAGNQKALKEVEAEEIRDERDLLAQGLAAAEQELAQTRKEIRILLKEAEDA